MTAPLFRTWLLVVSLTAAAMWVATLTQGSNLGVAGVMVILVASGIKAGAILRNFLELRRAPTGWQAFFYLYLAAIGVIVLTAHAGEPVLMSP